ncbi:MAG: glycosyltransferase family 4 protein [Bacteroidota bacterium]|nr:glycosyltransferase family 4 protein [Bacteroidota bacterium]
MKTIIHFTLDFFPNRGWSESLIMPIIEEQSKENKVIVITKAISFEKVTYKGIIVYKVPLNFKDINGYENKLEEIISDTLPNTIIFHSLALIDDTEFLTFCKNNNISTYLMLHHPSLFCLRGDLVRNGQSICNGVLDAKRCSICYTHSLGLPLVISKLMHNFSPGTLDRISYLFKSKLKTALSIYRKTTFLIEKNKKIFQLFTGIITINNWTGLALIDNGIDKDKILKVPICLHKEVFSIDQREYHKNENLKAIYVGRITRDKGVHLIVKAVSKILKEYKIELDLYGPIDELYYKKYVLPYVDSINIRYKGILPDNDVISTMYFYDVVLISSLLKETGPLTVLEAFAAGTPVIATNNGGLNELVEDNVNGLLVNFNDINDWIRKIKSIIENKSLLNKLSTNAKLPTSRKIEVMHSQLKAVLQL